MFFFFKFNFCLFQQISDKRIYFCNFQHGYIILIGSFFYYIILAVPGFLWFIIPWLDYEMRIQLNTKAVVQFLEPQRQTMVLRMIIFTSDLHCLISQECIPCRNTLLQASNTSICAFMRLICYFEKLFQRRKYYAKILLMGLYREFSLYTIWTLTILTYKNIDNKDRNQVSSIQPIIYVLFYKRLRFKSLWHPNCF